MSSNQNTFQKYIIRSGTHHRGMCTKLLLWVPWCKTINVCVADLLWNQVVHLPWQVECIMASWMYRTLPRVLVRQAWKQNEVSKSNPLDFGCRFPDGQNRQKRQKLIMAIRRRSKRGLLSPRSPRDRSRATRSTKLHIKSWRSTSSMVPRWSHGRR